MKIIMMFFVLFIASCSTPVLENYKNEVPKLDLKSFFNGKILAQGIVEDRSGKVIKRFDVDILASWDKNVGTIDEKFIYSDGKKESRIWKLTEISPNKFQGEAADVEGVALGEVAGNTFLFEYKLNVPVDDSTYRIHFEDWMYLLKEDTLLARTKMTKWGFKVGEVTIIMTKRDK